MTRIPLGAWACRSGNGVDVFLRPPGSGAERLVDFEWDHPPPLSAADQLDYDLRILPAVVRRVQEYLERPGSVLVVRA